MSTYFYDDSSGHTYRVVLEHQRHRAAAIAALHLTNRQPPIDPPPVVAQASPVGDGQPIQIFASDTIAVREAVKVTVTPAPVDIRVTPITGKLTVTGSLPVVHAVGTVTPTRGSGRTIVNQVRAISFFIPKTIREPFFGDLLESMAEMDAEGYSPREVRWAAISQIALLLMKLVWSMRRPRS
jgi:hypothetical protein